jgi:hypothetical protein
MKQSLKSKLGTGGARMAVAFGALAVGALAIGALAIGRLAIRKMQIGDAKFKSLEVGELKVKRLQVDKLITSSDEVSPTGKLPQSEKISEQPRPL